MLAKAKCSSMREDSLTERRRWLEQATVDLRWAEDLVERGGYHFLAQQVADKALKGLLYARGLEIVLGHSVERLCREAAEWEPDIEKGGRRWAILDSYYVPTRYPNSVPGNIPARVYTAEAAQVAVVLAREVVEWVEAKMQSLQMSRPPACTSTTSVSSWRSSKRLTGSSTWGGRAEMKGDKAWQRVGRRRWRATPPPTQASSRSAYSEADEWEAKTMTEWRPLGATTLYE